MSMATARYLGLIEFPHIFGTALEYMFTLCRWAIDTILALVHTEGIEVIEGLASFELDEAFLHLA